MCCSFPEHRIIALPLTPLWRNDIFFSATHMCNFVGMMPSVHGCHASIPVMKRARAAKATPSMPLAQPMPASQSLTRVETHLCVLSQGAIGGSEGERQVLHIPIVVAQEEQLLVELRVQGGQVVQVAALVQQLLQEEASQRQLQQDPLQATVTSSWASRPLHMCTSRESRPTH